MPDSDSSTPTTHQSLLLLVERGLLQDALLAYIHSLSGPQTSFEIHHLERLEDTAYPPAPLNLILLDANLAGETLPSLLSSLRSRYSQARLVVLVDEMRTCNTELADEADIVLMKGFWGNALRAALSPQ